MNSQLVNSIHAAKVHKEVMKDLHEKKIVAPGKSVNEIVDFIESTVKEKIKYDPQDPLKGGCAFPANVSINNQVAHYTSSSKNSDIILQEKDIVKVDFGVHKKGGIIDSACTFSFHSKYDEFIETAKKATRYAISQSGPDVNLGDLGQKIEEYVTSKEVTIGKETFPLFTLKELSGHNIGPYRIHHNKAVPNCKIDYDQRMVEGEFYAIEPFIATGSSHSYYDDPSNLLMINPQYKDSSFLNNPLLSVLYNKYNYLCFCDRWLENDFSMDRAEINPLLQKNMLQEFKTIYVPKEHHVAQFEHNIYIKNNGIIIITENEYY